MKTTRKCSRQQIVNRNIIISILLAAVLGIFNSASAQDANPVSIINSMTSVFLNSELTEERLNSILAVDESEMEIEDWMTDPVYWENVSKEIEKKYYSLVIKEDTEPELELEPWMLNFHNEIKYDNYYVAEEEQEVEDWMLDLYQFQYVTGMVANR
jgi:hypothetical protein